MACQLGFENGDDVRFALIEDFIGVTRGIPGWIEVWMLRQRLDMRFYVGVTVFTPATTGPLRMTETPFLAEIYASGRRPKPLVVDTRMITEPRSGKGSTHLICGILQGF